MLHNEIVVDIADGWKEKGKKDKDRLLKVTPGFGSPTRKPEVNGLADGVEKSPRTKPPEYNSKE